MNYNTNNYLSCEVLLIEDKKSALLGQPHMVMKLEEQYVELEKGNHIYRATCTPHYGVTRAEDKISAYEQQVYRLEVGGLLHLVKHKRHNIVISVCDLSKCMDGATPGAPTEINM